MDDVCDYIPFVSTFTNIVDIAQKGLLKLVSSISQTAGDGLKSSHYFEHIRDDKSLLLCAGLLIPGVNIYVKIHSTISYKLNQWYAKEKERGNSKTAEDIVYRINEFLGGNSQGSGTHLFLSGKSSYDRKKTEKGVESLPDIFDSPEFKFLYSVDLEYNFLNELPPSFYKLPNLNDLKLDHNNFETLPPEISNLSELVILSINNNELKNLPPEIGNLMNLTQLNLNDNELQNLPLEIGNLSNLKTLMVSSNSLESVPQEIGSLSKLNHFDLSDNQIKELPKEMVKLSELSTLKVNGNYVSKLPESLSSKGFKIDFFKGEERDTNRYSWFKKPKY